MPANEQYPDESDEEFEARMKLSKVGEDLGQANEGVDPAEGGLETGGLKTGGLKTGGLLPDPNKGGTNFFGQRSGQGTGELKDIGGISGARGGLKTGGLETSGLETSGLETGPESGEEPSKPSQTAQEFGSGQRAPAGGKPDTQKPEEAPYQRKRAEEIGIVANREERNRGRQKFAEEIGGAGGYDKLSGEQKDRGLELGLQERDIQKFYDKKDDRRRR